MKKIDTPETNNETMDDLRAQYHFDYSKARPNRFASHLNKDQIMVSLDPDVAAVFTNSESVNKILRALIGAMPETGILKQTRKRPSNR